MVRATAVVGGCERSSTQRTQRCAEKKRKRGERRRFFTMKIMKGLKVGEEERRGFGQD